MKHLLPLVVLSAALFALANAQQGQSCCGGMMSMQHGTKDTAKPVQAKQFDHKQTATIKVYGGYSPSVIEVQKGKPVELTFTAGKNPGCAGTIVFKTLKLTKQCDPSKSVVVMFTPKEKGEIPFACGMGMYKGKVIVK